MKRHIVELITFVVAITCWVSVEAADRPADRVIAMYFHRTERCPTCQKMGSYAEEAVKQGFKQQVKNGTVEFHFIDFQDKKNSKYVKAYDVSEPALIIARIEDNKVKKFKNLEDIWAKVPDKSEFIKYVQDSVKSQLK